jgi:hypothetical protein
VADDGDDMSGLSQDPENRWTIIELKEKVIDDGIAEVEEVYPDDDPRKAGAIEGFELARSLNSRESFEKVIRHRLMREMNMHTTAADTTTIDRYWRHHWTTLQLEWVLDCLKVACWAREGDLLSSRAARKVAEVLRG